MNNIRRGALARRGLGLFGLIFAGGLFLSTTAQGATLTLSDVSSDETDPALLDATLEFTVVDATTVTLTVTNLTADPTAYTIDQIAFNTTDNITSITLTEIDGVTSTDWLLASNTVMDGFGVYDWSVTQDTGSITNNLQPGDSITFTFTVDGTDILDTNFTTELSAIPPGDIQAYASVKFVQGPGDDSAYGAVVPIPAAAWLFGSALLGILGIGDRRRS